MSMLTPLGSGGRSSSRSRGRRRWPRLLLVLLVLALVAGGGYAAWKWLSEDETAAPASASPSEVCRTPSVKSPKALPFPPEVTVAVANGTDRAGLAIDTADALAGVGFEVSDIGNTSKPVKKGVAEVRYPDGDLAAAITVASYVPGSELVEVKSGPDVALTLWLGPDFSTVASPDEASPESVTLPTPAPICRTPKS